MPHNTPRFYTLNDDGHPVPTDALETWARSLTRYRLVARDMDGNVSVLTAFLGIDHDFTGDGPPVLWKTRVFGGPLDGLMARYPSKAEALAGHRDIWRRVTAAGIPRARETAS